MIEEAAIALTGASLAVSAALLVKLKRTCKSLQREHKARRDAEELAETSAIRAQAEYKSLYDRQLNLAKEQHRLAFEADNARLVSQALLGKTAEELRQKINAAISQRVGRTTQEIVGNLCDESEAMVRDIQFDLMERIWDAFQQFKEASDQSPLVMPDGIKIAYTKGHRTVLVVEQKPQTRTVAFTPKLLTRKVAEQAKDRSENGYRYTLAFPYVYFVLVFDKGHYKHHELYFRNKSLTSPREHIYLAPLPNVWSDGDKNKTMCMGNDFNKAVAKESTIARQCELAISDFWQRPFSDDLGEGDYGKIDKRIRNFAEWQKNTEKDPLFILQVNWLKGKTIKGVIEALLDNRTQSHELDPVDKTIRYLLENGVAKLTDRVNGEINSVKEKHLLKPHDYSALDAGDMVQELVLGHTKKVFESCEKQS